MSAILVQRINITCTLLQIATRVAAAKFTGPKRQVHKPLESEDRVCHASECWSLHTTGKGYPEVVWYEEKATISSKGTQLSRYTSRPPPPQTPSL